MNERMNEWTNKWMNERMNEWMNMMFYDRFDFYEIIGVGAREIKYKGRPNFWPEVQ